MILPYRVSTGPYKTEILRAFESVLDSGMFVLGDWTEKFEKIFAESHGRRYGVAVTSDTAALEAALLMLEPQRNDNFVRNAVTEKVVLMPDTAFYGCANVVFRLNGKVLPVDVTVTNGLMPTLDQLKAAVAWTGRSPKELVYMAVYTAGTAAADAIETLSWCKEQGIPVVEDAAHCHGALYTDGKLVGSYGDVATFSFYATKMIHSGEGGMLLLDSPEQAQWLRSYRNYGKLWGPNADPVFTDVAMLGSNWRMTEFQAALGAILWLHYEEIRKARAGVEAIYDRFFHPITGAWRECVQRLLVLNGKLKPNLYRYIVMVDGLETAEQNRKLYALLKKQGVLLQAKCNSMPLVRHSVLKDKVIPYPPSLSPQSEASRYCLGHLCLPIYPSLSEIDASYVAETLVTVVEKGEWR